MNRDSALLRSFPTPICPAEKSCAHAHAQHDPLSLAFSLFRDSYVILSPELAHVCSCGLMQVSTNRTQQFLRDDPQAATAYLTRCKCQPLSLLVRAFTPGLPLVDSRPIGSSYRTCCSTPWAEMLESDLALGFAEVFFASSDFSLASGQFRVLLSPPRCIIHCLLTCNSPASVTPPSSSRLLVLDEVLLTCSAGHRLSLEANLLPSVSFSFPFVHQGR